MAEMPRIVVAMDFHNTADCLAMAERLDPQQCRMKIGKELFTAEGPSVVEALMKRGFDVFLDLKFHDIPNTVAKAVSVAADLGVWMVNVHASGGERMMAAAREAIEQHSGSRKPLLIAVTVLTSMDDSDLHGIGVDRPVREQVMLLAHLAQQNGMDGVVCSAQEAEGLSQAMGSDFCLVTPGIRPADATADDQRRIVTPAQAISNGSHYLVIGRPITQAADPAAACRAILATLQQ